MLKLFTFRINRLIIIRMNDLTRKSSNRLTREQEREASRYFGKHVTPAKAAVSLCFALLTAASPMLLGLHLWKQIPEIVETGLTAINGEDDSIPRAVLVFGHVRADADLSRTAVAAPEDRASSAHPDPYHGPLEHSGNLCAALLLLAPPRGGRGDGVLVFSALPARAAAYSARSFRFPSILHWETPWRKTHRLAGVCWMLAGLQLLVFTFVLGTLPWYSFVLALFLLLSEFPAEAYYAKQEG